MRQAATLPRIAQRCLAALATTACLGFNAGTASAAPVLLSGAHFDVEYDNAATGVFGVPTIGGDVVFFTPTTLKAQSLNGAGLVTTSAGTAFRIIAHSGFLIGSADLTARGGYRMLGASSTVNVGGTLSATPAGSGGAPLSSAIAATTPFTFRDGQTRNWEASALLDFGGAPLGGFADIGFDLQSVLSASTSLTDPGLKLAFIEETFAGSEFALKITQTGGQVPEPAPLALGLASLLGWFGVRRRVRDGREPQRQAA